MSSEVQEKIERFKLLSQEFLKDNKKIFIKDVNDQFYFAEILYVGENTIEIKCFAPKSKSDEKFYLNWMSILKLEEYQEKDE